MTALASIADVEAVVMKTVPSDARARMLRVIEMVSSRVIRYTGQDFVEVIGDSVVIHPHDGEIRLPQLPVTSVTSVTIAGNVIDPSQYETTTNGYLKRILPFNWVPDSQFWGPGDWNRYGVLWPISGEFGWPPIPTTIVYTHGYAPGRWPDEISLVVAEKVAAKWLAGETNASNLVGESIDGYSQRFNKITPTNSWDPEHKEILDEYRRRAKFSSVRLG